MNGVYLLVQCTSTLLNFDKLIAFKMIYHTIHKYDNLVKISGGTGIRKTWVSGFWMFHGEMGLGIFFPTQLSLVPYLMIFQS